MAFIFILLGIVFGSVVLDQVTKFLAVTYLEPIGSFPIIKQVLHLTYVENKGAAFGMLSDNRWVFMIVSSVALVALSIYLFRFCKENEWVKISLAMIIGGGIGNMIDRTILGYVVDFIDFTLIDFAVFNVADSFITVGCGILIVRLLLEIISEEKARKNATVPPHMTEKEQSGQDSSNSEEEQK